jgi:FAD/FMN-containing dehydrogenase
MTKGTKRAFLIGAGTALAGMGLWRFASGSMNSRGPAFPVFDSFVSAKGNILNDASQLEPTEIKNLVLLNARVEGAFIHQLRGMIRSAGEQNHPLIASTARHSMGGQSIPDKGVAVSLVQSWIEPNVGARTYRVGAGTRWQTVIKELDKIGFSPKIMQSNNDFGVASTFSVNAHGWPVAYPGCGSSVRSMKMMFPDGVIRTCSRTENADVFRHAMGGYGLFGVILELELEMVSNMRLEPRFDPVEGRQLGQRFADTLAADRSIEMAYGRLDVSLDNFFNDGLLITFRPTEDQGDLPTVEGSGLVSMVSADIFRMQTESELSKEFRWWTEKTLGPSFTGITTRNNLMNEPVITLDDGDPTRTDILHEYFVPPDRFADFVEACRAVIPASYQQLLNVTVRYVGADTESVLAYAPEPRIASVMLFSQEMSLRGEEDMRRMTHALIERVLDIGGSYYLPYRPHASLDQLKRSYPGIADFVAFKRKLDPKLIFRNLMWDRYFSKL